MVLIEKYEIPMNQNSMSLYVIICQVISMLLSLYDGVDWNVPWKTAGK